MCLTLYVCVSVFFFCASMCVCQHGWIAYLPISGWLRCLVLGTRPDCPSANITRPKCTLSTSCYTQTQSSREQCWSVRANVPPNAVDTHCCLYTHGTFFHRLSYQFNQEMKNKQDFCAAVFVFDKWFIWWKVWSRPCPQYLFQAVADSSRSQAEYL